jgi:hypothetical protein
MVLVTHHLVGEECATIGYPSPDELRAPDTRPFGPVALEYHAFTHTGRPRRIATGRSQP